MRQARPTRVLVVEDDRGAGEALSGFMRFIGYDADVATSGGEALARLRREHYDAVITDLWMPGDDGWAVARVLARPGDVEDLQTVVKRAVAAIAAAEPRPRGT